MKTISEQQAVQQFHEYSELAHHGEKILVTRSGKPWVFEDIWVDDAVGERFPRPRELVA